MLMKTTSLRTKSLPIKRRRAKILSVFLIVTIAVLSLFYGSKNLFFEKFLIRSGISSLFKTGIFIKDGFTGATAYFRTKNSLESEIKKLQAEKSFLEIKTLDYDKILKEKETLLALFGRIEEKKQYILAGVFSAPPLSPYDTLLVDAGLESGVKKNMEVYSADKFILGRIEDVFPNSSSARLFSFPGEPMEVVFVNTGLVATATGIGGGNFIAQIPASEKVQSGETVQTTGLYPSIIGEVGKVEINEANPFQIVRFRFKENIQQLRFILIKK